MQCAKKGKSELGILKTKGYSLHITPPPFPLSGLASCDILHDVRYGMRAGPVNCVNQALGLIRQLMLSKSVGRLVGRFIDRIRESQHMNLRVFPQHD